MTTATEDLHLRSAFRLSAMAGAARRAMVRLAGFVRHHPGVAIALVVLAVLVLAALFAPQIAPHAPMQSYYDAVRQAPSWRFPFGTDELGRDVFSRVIYGAQISLRVGATTTALSLGVGTLLALLATLGPRALGHAIMRVMDVLLAFPGILLALAVVAVLGRGIDNVLIAIAISLVPGYVRTVRSMILGVSSNEYVAAARILGGGRIYIAVRHVLPNILGGIVVLGTLGIALVTLEVAALSYVGLGARPPEPEWGAMLTVAREYLDSAWWMAVFPGLAITVTVLSINAVGDWLRDVVDPRSRR